MLDIVERLQSQFASDAIDPKLVEDAITEIGELRRRSDVMEELLILLVRTTEPWDEAGEPTEYFPGFRERYHRVMHEAAELLGLETRSTITRTEPRT
jgi:hypothetical protein